MAAEGQHDGTPVRSPRDVVEYFGPRMEDLPVEEFHFYSLRSQDDITDKFMGKD